MKKKLLLGAASACLLIIIGGGVYAFHNHKAKVSADSASTVPSQQEADQVFRNYLLKSAKMRSSASEEQYADATTKEPLLSVKSSMDFVGKKVASSADITCKAQIADAPITFNVTVQTENTTKYLRLNTITGNLVDVNSGQQVDLSRVFAGIRGTWYKLSDNDAVMQSQLDSGIFVFNSAVVAPNYDSQKLVDKLLSNHAYTYSLNEKVGDHYVYSFRSDRFEYLSDLQYGYPSLKSPEDVITSVFGTADQEDSTITVTKDGTLVREEWMPNDVCGDLVPVFAGPNAQNTTPAMSGTNKPVSPHDVHITAVTKSKPIADMANDLSKSNGGGSQT